MKGKSLRRALKTSDIIRIGGDVPLLADSTELITPDIAFEFLSQNKNNRPINWKKVEEYAAIMKRGEWKLHSQGIILDTNNNILTGQKRLWAIIYANATVNMRVSRGNPPDVASVLDRGTPQSSRDLASRRTGRKHSPVEVSIARGILALSGNLRPSTDALADALEKNAALATAALHATAGTRKTRPVVAVIAVVCSSSGNAQEVERKSAEVKKWADELERRLAPQSTESCWGKGAAFSLAMAQASKIVAGL